MAPTLFKRGSEAFLYDAESRVEIESRWFDLNFQRQHGRMTTFAQGRGATYYFPNRDDGYVLRHYRRGGAMASWLDDRYLWTGLERTRAFREWRLLATLWQRNFPVPCPIVARVVRCGVCYRADLITRTIKNSHTLATLLMRSPLSFEQWRKIGHTIRGFHDAGVYHADLNAHNILVDSLDEVFMIDFDKGAMRTATMRWKQSNLQRLHRSLLKLKRLHPRFSFNDNAFHNLLEAYREG